MRPTSETIETLRYDCQARCQNASHARQIITAIHSTLVHPTLAQQDQQQLAAYVVKCCRNFARVRDANGTTALHAIAQLPANRSLVALAAFLISHRADVNAIDTSTQRTPLHYACIGHNMAVAALLQRHGADTELCDTSAFIAFDYLRACGDEGDEEHALIALNCPHRDATETWVWGDVHNGNVGLVRDRTGHSEVRPLDTLNRSLQRAAIRMAAVSALHCLLLDADGALYVVGNGRGGILGIDSENTVLEPRLVAVPLPSKDYIVAVSASRYTSMLLTAKGNIFTCGTNVHQQLGYEADKQLVFRRVRFPLYPVFMPTAIHASDTYSMAHDGNRTLYVWGTSSGQFGSTLREPGPCPITQLPFDGQISQAFCSEGAIVMQLNEKLMFTMHHFQTQAIWVPNHLIVLSAAIDVLTDAFRMALLTTDGPMLYVTNLGVVPITSPASLHIDSLCSQMLFVDHQLMFVAKGYVYSGTLETEHLPMRKKTTRQNAYEVPLRGIKRVRGIDRVHRVHCDSDGKSFVAIVRHSVRCLLPMPAQRVDLVSQSMRSLRAEAFAGDGLADCVLHVHGRQFAVHRFVLWSRAPEMRALFDEADVALPGEPIAVRLSDVTPVMVELVLKHVYENYTIRESDVKAINGDAPDQSNYKRFIEFAKRCGVFQFAVGINKTHERTANRLDRQHWPETSDITLVCRDSVAAGEQRVEFRAHKCVLVSRSEYFRMMFAHNWAEKDRVEMANIRPEVMRWILDYLYSYDAEPLLRASFSESDLIEMICVCDQLLLDSLSTVFGHLLSERITPKKCFELLRFACQINQTDLREQCLRYICSNAARFLERRTFDDVDEEVFELLGEMLAAKPKVQAQLDAVLQPMTPDNWLSMDELLRVAGTLKIDFDAPVAGQQLPKVPATKAKAAAPNNRTKKSAVTSALMDGSDLSRAASAKAPNGEGDSSVAESAESVSVPAEPVRESPSKWSTVNGKAAAVKPPVVHTNQVLAQEEKMPEEYVKLLRQPSEPATPPPTAPTNDLDEAVSRMTVQLGAFGVTKRVSQAARKRLASAKEPLQAAAWADSQQLTEPVSPRSPLSAAASVQKSPTSLNPEFPDLADFRKIQREEKREKANLSKMMNKKLWMTQAEEAAIAELKEFYAVDHVFDERITIERVVPEMRTRNPTPSAWYQNKESK